MSQRNGIKINPPKKKYKGKKLTTPTSLWTSNHGNHASPTMEHKKVLALIKAKIKKTLTAFDKVDGYNNFQTDVMKWKKVSFVVMSTCS
jgi:hypothetical protein